jgi:RHS repeat-associated protein
VDGNLLTRTATSGAGQSLSWDDEGHLASVTATGTNPGVTKYLYDADGNQLIRRDPGRTTLFAGDTQIVIDTSVNPPVSLGADRTYTLGGSGAAIAQRSTLPGGGTFYLFNDPHGTATLAMDTTTQKVARQQYKPYGETRNSVNNTAWPDPTHGYLGATTDLTSGYTDLGARKYDPTLGRFISVDPILETGDPNQLGGYTYAGDNPVANADPNGLCVTDACISHQNHLDDRDKPPAGGVGTAGAAAAPPTTANRTCRLHRTFWFEWMTRTIRRSPMPIRSSIETMGWTRTGTCRAPPRMPSGLPSATAPNLDIPVREGWTPTRGQSEIRALTTAQTTVLPIS